MPHTLPPLPYPPDALEPHLDRQTMEIHHGKHHQAYVNNLNKALEGAPELQGKPLEALLRDLNAVPPAIRAAVRNHGGGTWNHAFYWEGMGPGKGGEPTGRVAEALTAVFGGCAAFKERLSAAAAGHFGSGWAWLIRTKDGRLEIVSSPNQDCPISEGHTPILVIDLWEHAYYLKYQNRRPEFIAAWWNVVSWDTVGRRLQPSAP
jgi:Fe-Mn family superoxide dismutase